mmetsp:Transcript_5932/g.20753  ORF Transcript_5932/g.20753 Transcript_5932/m.20753 type:complete len:218 (+) Transcript_5932:7930-8583(+)
MFMMMVLPKVYWPPVNSSAKFLSPSSSFSCRITCSSACSSLTPLSSSLERLFWSVSSIALATSRMFARQSLTRGADSGTATLSSSSMQSTSTSGSYARSKTSSNEVPSPVSLMGVKPQSSFTRRFLASSNCLSLPQLAWSTTEGANLPVNFSARFTTTPSASWMRASTSPASMGAPGLLSSVTFPGPFWATSGITVFMTSISAYGCPGCTVSWSSTR